MPANQFVDLGAAVNFRAESVSIELAGTYCGPYAYATVFRPTGPRPGYAQITIRHAPNEVARKARSVALNADGLAGKAIIGPEVVVKRRTAGDSPVSDAFHVGNLAIPEHDIGKDNLLLMTLDRKSTRLNSSH